MTTTTAHHNRCQKRVGLVMPCQIYSTGAYISKNPTHFYLPDWAYLAHKSGKNLVKERSEYEINSIFELIIHENRWRYIDSLFNIIYEFDFLDSFIFWSYLLNCA